MKQTMLRRLLLISLLLNFLLVGPLLLLSPHFFLTSDGIAFDVSHGRVENLFQKTEMAKRFVIQPPSSPNNDNDLNSVGKSCIFEDHSNAWKCQECHKGNCQELQPVRQKCYKPMTRTPWDKPARAYSSYDPTAVDPVEMRTLRELATKNTMYLKQPMCTMASSCFNLSKCDSNILTIYTNQTSTTNSTQWFDYAVNQSSLLKRVYHPQQACISVTFPDTYTTASQLHQAQHWQQAQEGRNNLLWDMGNFRMSSWTPDHPYQQFHYQYAIVASQSIAGPLVRPGYDLVLPLVRKWHRPSSTNDTDIHRPRTFLLSFRGDIQHKGIPYYNHRWLAYTYWENATDVFVDVQCRIHHRVYQDYDDSSSPDRYSDLLWNSTFGFCPGGAGVSSYRLGEYLSTGAVPVVTGDIVGPMAPEVDWSGCWIRVSEARIVDLPRLLRRIPAREIQRRQKRCWQLLQMIWGEQEIDGKGWVNHPGTTFAKGMEIMAVRVANAIEASNRNQVLVDPGA